MKENLKALVSFAVSALVLGSGTIAFSQVIREWQPFLGAKAGAPPAPCTFGNHTGQITQWDPSTAGTGITVSGGGFIASYTGASNLVGITAFPKVPGRHTGKWYYAAHINSGGSTGWVFGGGNGSFPNSHYPGGQDNHSFGVYTGNFVTQSSPTPQTFVPPSLTPWTIIAKDLDNNLAWAGNADASCNIGTWSGPITSNGSPSAGTGGMDISQYNDGISVFPAWGGSAASGLQEVELYTNTPMTGVGVGWKYWDQL